ncbi:UBC-like protein [Morchella conica CCBAS932]|uniref:UBC-like protein n=1 Tax=Morchella conica CCBAS932 TaxID=1392247 RepID=A0A3N4KIV4_9PEZI|nr:UBC-like protein [Morchella conica CCBAS932]
MSQNYNKKSPTIKRILREAAELASAPSPDYHAAPLESNLMEWHFTIRGPPSTPYANGIYHGRIALPPQYPLRPPSFRFLTPSGRFEVNREICLSISGHHEDTWQPAWGVRTAVVALRGFMEGEAKGQLGGMECSAEIREKIAGESGKWKCEGCGGQTNEEILAESAARAKELGEKEEEALPEGLKLAYKDEMKKEESTPSSSSSSSSPATPAPIPTPTTTAGFAHTPTPPQPITPQYPNPPQQQVHTAPLAQRAETPWLDKFIWALVVALAALVAKRYWGLEIVVL